MRNLSALRVVFFAATITLRPFVSYADGEIRQVSKPVFEPDAFKEKTEEADPFLGKLREKRNEFVRKELKRRREFHEDIQMKDWTDEERGEKIAAFHQKEIKRMQDFMAKQQRQIEKHHQKDNESLWKKLF